MSKLIAYLSNKFLPVKKLKKSLKQLLCWHAYEVYINNYKEKEEFDRYEFIKCVDCGKIKQTVVNGKRIYNN